MNWEGYKQDRQRTVQLAGGYTCTLRQPCMKRALLMAKASSGEHLKPGYLSLLAILRVQGKISDNPIPDDPVQRAEWRNSLGQLELARYDDLRALGDFALCDAAVHPRLLPTQAETDAYNEAEREAAKQEKRKPIPGLCIFDLAESDRDVLEAAAFELVGIGKKEAEQIAPFREPRHPAALGKQLGQACARIGQRLAGLVIRARSPR